MKHTANQRLARSRAYANPGLRSRQFQLPVSYQVKASAGRAGAFGEDQETALREQRALGIAAMGLVSRVGDRFLVASAISLNRSGNCEVWFDDDRHARCSCREFAVRAKAEPEFRCEHILAVNYSRMSTMNRRAADEDGSSLNLSTARPGNWDRSVPNMPSAVPERRFFSGDPYAQTVGDLVTPRQLGFIRLLSREAEIDSDEECRLVMNCFTDDLSKSAASAFIEYLQELPRHTGESRMRLAS